MDFDVSSKAKERLEKEFPGKSVRIFPYRKSWTGVIFDLALDEPKDDDNVYSIGSVKLIVNKKIETYAKNIKIDYENYEWGSDYVITTRFWFDLMTGYNSFCHLFVIK